MVIYSTLKSHECHNKMQLETSFFFQIERIFWRKEMKTEEMTDFGEKFLILPASILPSWNKNPTQKHLRWMSKSWPESRHSSLLSMLCPCPQGERRKMMGLILHHRMNISPEAPC